MRSQNLWCRCRVPQIIHGGLFSAFAENRETRSVFVGSLPNSNGKFEILVKRGVYLDFLVYTRYIYYTGIYTRYTEDFTGKSILVFTSKCAIFSQFLTEPRLLEHDPSAEIA